MTRALLRKELAVLWASPLPFLVGVLFNAATAVLFVNQLEGRRQAVLQPLFPIAGFLLVALVPLLAMRSLSEEKRSGTLEILLAIPVPSRALVVAKWIATALTSAACAAPTFVLVALVALWGNPDWGVIATGYMGLLLLIASTAAVGVLASAVTDVQAVAGVAGVFVNLLLWFSYAAPEAAGTSTVLSRLSLSERLRAAAGGVVDIGDVTYFVALGAVAVVLAVAAVGRRLRWPVVVALAVTLGIAAVADRAAPVFDMTADDTSSLTDTSRAVADGVAAPTKITAFLRRSEPGRAEAAALLSRYQRENRRISFRVVDPDGAPGEVRRLGVDPALGGIAVERGERIERAPTAAEQDVTAALARLQRTRATRACFLTGHGERALTDESPTGMSGLGAVLEANGFSVASVATPDGCDALVVAGPTASMGDMTVTGPDIRSFVSGGGRMLLLTDPESTADVSSLLAGSGMRVERGVIIEGRASAHVPGDPTTPIVAAYRSGFPFVRRLPPTFFPGAQAVVVDSRASEGVAAAAVAQTTSSATLEGSRTSLDAPLAIVAASDVSRVDDGRVVRSRFVVSGDVDFASNAFVNELGNGLLLVQALDWLTLQEDIVSISANLPRPRPLVLTAARLTYARMLGAGIVPMLFVFAGAIVWAMRRGR